MLPIQREWTIGEAIFRFEPPDILRIEYRGPCFLPEAAQVVDLCRELGTTTPLYLLVDMEEAGIMDADARRYLGEQFQIEWIMEMIVYKARLKNRALFLGLRLAIEMARDEEGSLLEKLHFAPTREKAEALLERLRARTG